MNPRDKKSVPLIRPHGRKQALMPELLRVCGEFFAQLEKAYPKAVQSQYSLRDCALLFMATFLFKFPSLNQFLAVFDPDDVLPSMGWSKQQSGRLRQNLRTLFDLATVPTDKTARVRVDEVKTEDLHGLFPALLGSLGEFSWRQDLQTATGELLLVIDGTQSFSSKQIHCDHCRITKHQDGTRTYSHQAVVAAVVHPTDSTSLPIGVEPVSRQDGVRKNDCEQVAAKRLLRRIREQYPELKFMVVADALYATGPMIKLLEELSMSYLLVVKPGRHQQGPLAYWARSGHAEARWHVPSQRDATAERQPRDRGTLRYRVLPKQALNGKHPELQGTVLQGERWPKKGGRKLVGEWFTNHPVTPRQAAKFVRWARRRWSIENCIFKTLKALTGMNFEHNFGHGKEFLSNNLTQFMVAAALMDQLSLLWCYSFQALRAVCRIAVVQWEFQRTYLLARRVANWTDYYQAMLNGFDPPESELSTG